MARLAQYWLMDFYSRVLDQRMSIVRRMKTWIMMGQNRQTPDILTEHEEQDRHAADLVTLALYVIQMQSFRHWQDVII